MVVNSPERRKMKRVRGLVSVLRSDAYEIASNRFGADMMPDPPDPYDRAVSKREWEYLVQMYRRNLKHLAFVVVPTLLESGALDEY